jgi:hypothetical protein
MHGRHERMQQRGMGLPLGQLPHVALHMRVRHHGVCVAAVGGQHAANGRRQPQAVLRREITCTRGKA